VVGMVATGVKGRKRERKDTVSLCPKKGFSLSLSFTLVA
jgi:hypothetical protein